MIVVLGCVSICSTLSFVTDGFSKRVVTSFVTTTPKGFAHDRVNGHGNNSYLPITLTDIGNRDINNNENRLDQDIINMLEDNQLVNNVVIQHRK